ncbi:DUF397 domain-containing protein [Actinomadura adrarensis]|uniref:DUF397 domain-containing protein n=1 Tax=Actinomadura adrarensis TaxID=1819600 RepID=A0ABW3CU12_9ACTN
MSSTRNLPSAIWKKSSYSGNAGNTCVEVARNLPGIVGVRDGVDPEGPKLPLGPDAWHRFNGQVKNGRHYA